MSFHLQTPENISFVHCNFCNTILAVSVPSNSSFSFVTVRCGYCAGLLFFYMEDDNFECESSPSSGSNVIQDSQNPALIRHPPAKRLRVPSAYNRFIKEEIQRIKANNPEISHKEAFSTAAKNWAHLPRLLCGADSSMDKQLEVDNSVSAKAFPKI